MTAGSHLVRRGSRWWVLGLIMLGTFMAILDSSIVNVALPHMMSAFGVSREQVEWVSTAFMLASAVSMPLVGWLVAKMGYKVLYAGSLFLFTLGSLACAAAWSFPALVGARVIQAVGGGMIQPVGMAIIAELFEPHERGRALGIWGTGIMVGPALGPTLGGYLSDWISWRSIFSINLPFGILGVLATLWVMKSDSQVDRGQRPLDVWGLGFLSMALIAGLLGLSNGQEKGWTSDYVLICGALTVIGTVMFLAVESACPHPLIDLKLFRLRNYSLSMVLSVFRSVGLFGGVFLLPIFLERLSGYTTIQTGLWMMPGAVSVGLLMPLAGRLADRYRAAVLVTAGTALTAVSLMAFGRLDPDSGALMIVGPQLVRGVGLALMVAPMMTAALNSVPRAAVATASGFLNIAGRLGGAFGISVLNVYVTHSTRVQAVRLASNVPPASEHFRHATATASHLVVHSARAASLSPQAAPLLLAMRTFMERATVRGFQAGFVFAGVILCLGLPLSMALKHSAHRSAGSAPEIVK